GKGLADRRESLLRKHRPRAISMGDNLGSAGRAADRQAEARTPPPRNKFSGSCSRCRQKLGFAANGVSCNSCVQHDLSWMCRYQYASAILTGLMMRSVRFWLRGSLRLPGESIDPSMMMFATCTPCSE